jgi:hypothetical protein
MPFMGRIDGEGLGLGWAVFFCYFFRVVLGFYFIRSFSMVLGFSVTFLEWLRALPDRIAEVFYFPVRYKLTFCNLISLPS